MEIYDRVQAETTKAGLSESDWVGAFKHDARQNWSHNDTVEISVGRDWCLTETAFPKVGLCTWDPGTPRACVPVQGDVPSWDVRKAGAAHTPGVTTRHSTAGPG